MPKTAAKRPGSGADSRPKGPSGVIDLDHLHRYSGGDAALEAELLGLFRDQLGKQIAGLEMAVDGPSWKLAAHSLKGAARAIGAWRIDALADQLETLGINGEARRRQALLDELAHEIARAKQALDRL